MRASTFLLSMVVLSSGITALSYFLLAAASADAQRLPVEVTVAEFSGFNLDTDMVHMGSFQPGSAGFRHITITNHEASRAFRTRVQGEIAPWVDVQPASGVIGAEPLDLTLSVSIPENATFGSRQGELIIFFDRP